MTPSTAALTGLLQSISGSHPYYETVAPEPLPGALETIAHARAMGVHSSLGQFPKNCPHTKKPGGIAAGRITPPYLLTPCVPGHRDRDILGAIIEDKALRPNHADWN